MEPVEIPATPTYEVLYCPQCKKALGSRKMQATCEHCLNEIYRVQMLQREDPAASHVTLITDGHRRKHIPLLNDRQMAYCGDRLSSSPKQRERVEFAAVPESICALCRSELGLLRAGRYKEDV
jgi:hypothetical protein